MRRECPSRALEPHRVGILCRSFIAAASLISASSTASLGTDVPFVMISSSPEAEGSTLALDEDGVVHDLARKLQLWTAVIISDAVDHLHKFHCATVFAGSSETFLILSLPLLLITIFKSGFAGGCGGFSLLTSSYFSLKVLDIPGGDFDVGPWFGFEGALAAQVLS